ncbi:lantibiotic dehydratase [Pedobacter sp. R20-19]|uniref:lantibiotic dehydratase n=1 Tax=Pedobacter sp. R20-19 TaxID=1270196 RepID=UPI000493AFC1|nr:lantibiotic dehydratase [Pedobacter sp. R20-19]
MKLNLHPTLIFRTPIFSYQSNLKDCWEELKNAIAISSGDFYETIKDVEVEDLVDLPPRIQFTIWKYFNRARYRATPYGTFASFGILKNAIKQTESKVQVSEEQIIHRLIDWPYRNQLEFDFELTIQQNGFLFSNSSFYATLNGIRYIACSDGVFELSEIDHDDFIVQILNACEQPIRLKDLILKLQLEQDRKSDLFTLLNDMHDLQLLFTDQDPNIIGEDFFERTGKGIEKNIPEYLIAERKAYNGCIDQSLLKAIPNLLDLLGKIIPKEEKTALTTFIRQFKKKFEQREVSLLMALDPEIGIGYDELEQSSEGDDFIIQFNNKKKDHKTSTDFKAGLKKALSLENFERGKTLFLNQLHLDLNEKPVPLPNSLSILIHIADDLILIDQIGGVTANALAGRFSMASDDITDFCKEISGLEESANPEVLFFDVAYMVEANVDNINRRKLVYSHQLSILNYDTSANPLLLNDIQISVRNDQVVLRSKSLNKRLMPRMASAYNYTRSDLAVFRLLCDLQHQGIQGSLSLPLDGIFPDLNYYPRLQYQNMVLNTQKWRVDKETFFPAKVQLSVDACRQFLTETGVSRYFKTGLSDQTLCFNLSSDEDLNALMQFIYKQKSIYLEEVILPTQNAVADEKAKPYLAQFVVSVTHHECIYHGASSINADSTGNLPQIFMPGKEWLYFEIFCHQQRADEILMGVIHPFLQVHAQEIKSWFFIRYNENGNHLRFRANLNRAADGQKLSASFADYLSPYFVSGLVSDFHSRAYRREIERYGSDLIAQVEMHFSVDSNFVLSMLQVQTDSFSKYSFCAEIVSQLLKHGVFEGEEIRQIIKLASDSFNQEHHLEAANFKKLNQQYQSYKSHTVAPLGEDQLKYFTVLVQSMVALLKDLPPNRKTRLFTDLMHMHVNRLFNKNQRTHEMVMYYFLLKDFQRNKTIESH